MATADLCYSPCLLLVVGSKQTINRGPSIHWDAISRATNYSGRALDNLFAVSTIVGTDTEMPLVVIQPSEELLN